MANCVATDLQTLANCFQQEAQNGQITIDKSYLTPAITQVLGNQDITVKVTGPSSVNYVSGSYIQITGTTTGDFLSLDGYAVCIVFFNFGNPSQIVLQMRVTLGTGWTFGESFPQLAGQAADDLCSSAAVAQYLYISACPQAQGVPAGACPDPNAPSSLAVLSGVSIWGSYGMFGPFTQLVALLPGGSTPDFQLYGAITESQPSEPVFDLQLQNTQGISFSIPGNIITVSQPTVGLTIEYVADANDKKQVSPVTEPYFGAEVSLGSFPLELRAYLWEQATFIDLYIQPENPSQASFADLVSLLGSAGLSQVQSLLESQPSVWSLLNAISFKQFNSTITINPPTLASVSALFGTVGYDATSPTPPASSWQPFSGVDLKLAFNCYTAIFTPASQPNALAELQATAWYSYSGGSYYSFTVTVSIPAWVITGQFNGTLDFNLSTLVSGLFGGSFTIPEDLLDFQITDFYFSADVPHSTYSFNAVINGVLFGSNVLQIINTTVGMSVNASGQSTTVTGTLNGIFSLGGIELALDATISNDPNVDTVITLHLVNETVGSMLNHLVHIVDPDYDVSFGEPWNKLLDISLDALVLRVTLPPSGSTRSAQISLTYNTTIDLGFMKITGLSLTYTQGTTNASTVMISLDGEFLGQQFGIGSENPPLGWDAINGSPPPVPGQGDSLFDLQYVGLGQHIAFQGVDLPDMTAVMKALRESVIPIQAGQLPPFGQNSLAFSADSNWLVGAEFSVMSTVAISIIFNDPNMYGVLIALYGEKASIFKGLSFEILYRKISDTIGVYHIELKLPDAMRYLRFGEVSITLPVVILDIYTNGNFRVDFGFPVGQDFSNSFALQIFPFVGFGGFYFALLDGATSTRVPKITNGTFSPVIEFGVGLSVGVGKTINMSVFSGGLTVTVEGILQGVLAWFNPFKPASSATYYWLQGTVAIVGTLYATIDFAIIKANINVTAYASVTLTMEAYNPVYINFSVGVSIRISVKVVFFTIHLSFSATIKASFTIGSTSQPPWQYASNNGGGNGASAKLAPDALPDTLIAQPQLRGQETLHSPVSLHADYKRMLRLAALPQSGPITTWPAVCVLPQGPQTVGLWAMPAFTKSEVTPGETDAILLLAAGNSINPSASTLNDHQKLAGPAPASATFNLLMQAMLAWGIYVETDGGTVVTSDQLADLQQQLKNPDTVAAAFDYTTLTNFLAKNFTFDISTQTEWLIAANGAVRASNTVTITTTVAHGFAVGNTVTISGVTDNSFDGQFTVATVPSPTTFTYAQDGSDGTSGGGTADVTLGVALFPMIPAIELTDTAGTSVSFSNFNNVDSNYQQKVDAYFQLLQVQFQQQNNGSSSPQAEAVADPTVSMATVVFGQYFNMLMSSGVQAAIDLLASYPYTTASAMSIADVATAVGDDDLESEPLNVVTPNQDQAVLNQGALLALPGVTHQILSGETFASIAAAFQAQGALNFSGQPYSASDLLTANPTTTGIFNLGVSVQFDGIGYTTLANDTLNLIAARLLLRAAGSTAINSINGLGSAAQALQQLNPTITDLNQPLDPATTPTITLAQGGSYSVVEGDTLTLIAAYFLGIQQSTVDIQTFLSSLLAIASNQWLVGTNPDQTLTVGKQIAMPMVAHAIAAGETIASLATTLLTTEAVIQTGLLAVPATTSLLAPQGVLNVPLQYAVAAADTFSGIAAKFNLTLQDVANQAVATQQNGEMTKIFAANQTITISDLTSINVETLMADLLNEAEWNNASGMVSRFMLSGLRLPDPNNSYFQSLTLQDLQNPAKLGAIVTKPMYLLTGQQFPITSPPPSGYQMTLANDAGVPWLNFSAASSATFALTAEQVGYLNIIATTALAPQVESLTRLSLFQMVPPRIALQNHITWQAAVPPAGCLSSQSATGNPAIWVFPDSLVQQVGQLTAPSLYEIVVATHTSTDQPVSAEQADCYAWATIIDFTIALPITDAPAPSVANAYVINGADDTGAELLQQVYNYLTSGSDTAALYLLYSPDPTSANPSGLSSDQLNAEATYILKTNLSTLTHSGGKSFAMLAASDPTQVYAASLSDTADFIALLWEASITRSGGFYLNYVNQNGGAAIPASVFGTASTATVSLLVLLNSQATNRDAAIQPFNNCAIVGGNIDTTTTSLFVQPATYIVQENDSLTSAQTNFNSAWGTSFTLLQTATFNQDVPLLLLVGAEMTIPGQSQPYEIAYGDTLAGIVAKFKVQDLQTLISAGQNATAPILETGAPMQFAAGVLQPATTVPPGTVGFEMTRTNPDPNSVTYDQLTPPQVVGSLFNLVGFSIAGEGGFTQSGVGLPTTPADSLQDQSDGLEQRNLDDSTDPNWYYHQTMAVYPFGNPQYGSASAALPPAQSNPYNGVGYNSNTKQINQVTLALDLQDIYGNIQALPSQFSSLQVPVGYYDDIVSLGSWPSLALSYLITGAQPHPNIVFNMTMQQSRYIPSPSVEVAAAVASVNADLLSYRAIYYQLAQPDLAFALQTSLDANSMASLSAAYPLAKTPFFAFAYGAYVYLAALATMQPVVVTSDGTANVQALTDQYGVTAAQLFTANQNTLYSALFGAASLSVPAIYSTAEGDTLTSIIGKWPDYDLTVTSLAELNQYVALGVGTDLATPTRTATVTQPSVTIAANGAARSSGTTTITTTEPHGMTEGNFVIIAGVADGSFNGQFIIAEVTGTTTFTLLQANQPDANSGGGRASQLTPSLAAIAQTAQASVAALAEANAAATNILQAGLTLTVGTNTYQLGANDSFNNAAQQLGATVAAVATANQGLQGLFVVGATLTVNDAVVTAGDSLATMAQKFTSGSVDTLATANAGLANLFAPSTQIQIGTNPTPKPPAETDSLASFAVNNSVTVDQLASANAGSSTVFADGAQVSIPGAMTNTSPEQYCTYTAAANDTLGGIAQKFDQTPAAIAALNPDIPGLLAGGQTVTDMTSGKSVPTQDGDTFNSIIARFQQEQSVTVSLAQLAADIASQSHLIVPGSLWICPPMLGAANGLNPNNTLGGLASAYNIVTSTGAPDVATLATANAAAIGLLAAGQTLTILGVTLPKTTSDETFNSLVNRLAESGVNATIAEVANAVATTPGLLNPQAMVVPVPPPSPPGNQATINPKFSAAVFQIAVNVVTTRNSQWVDPDFTAVTSVSKSVYGAPPEPDPLNSGNEAPFSLTQFATDLQAALPGLQVATGELIAEGDPESASTIWGVNFGSSFGPEITYQFTGAQTQYFALPPLSTALMGGSVNIKPYVSSQSPPFTGTPQSQSFQAVDLDVWLNTFLGAVDLFLTPAYAVPAYALDPTDTVNVVEQKQTLAEILSARLDYVLQVPEQGSLEDAKAAICQSMLTELSSAFTVDTIVQVPVTVSSPYTDSKSAPRLSGKIVMSDVGGTDASPQSLPNTFSFSTAKVSLVAPNATATYLFSVKSPAAHKDASLNLEYVVTELELPDPNSTIGDYEGSTWLKFILPLDNNNSNIGNVNIPVPLRSYPSPVTLASQIAQQSVSDPANATDLIGWDFGFTYQHDDAEQDTPLVAVTFNAANDPATQSPVNDANLNRIYDALAQFMAVYPALKDDLAVLPTLTPGTSNARALAAVQAFNQLVTWVAEAWQQSFAAAIFIPPTQVYYYQLQKQQSDDTTPMLTTLTISSINPDTGQAQQNPTVLWPAVVAVYGGNAYQLQLTGAETMQASYDYPADLIPADTALVQHFIFGGRQIAAANGAVRSSGVTTITTTSDHGFGEGNAVNIVGVLDASFDGFFTVASVPSATTFTYEQQGQPDSSSGSGTAGKVVATADSTLAAPQLFSFNGANVLSQQNARAGVAITRNLSLIENITTNPAFVYQTPLANFTSRATPSIFAGDEISIGSGAVTGIAAALGAFLETLLTSQNQWQPGELLTVRISAAYSYALATSAVGASGVKQLGALVPVLLAPSFNFDPTSDWNAGNSNSFVSQVQAVIVNWQQINQPVTVGGSFVFDLTIYAAQGQMQALIHTTSLQYSLA